MSTSLYSLLIRLLTRPAANRWGARPNARSKAVLLVLPLLLYALGGASGAEESRRPVRDVIGAAWTFAVHFKGEADLEVMPERVSCSLQPGTGRALIANGKPDSEASAAFGRAIAALRALAPLGYPLPNDPLSGLDVTLTFGKGDLPHQGAGQGLAYAVAAYSVLTSTLLLGDVALAGTIDEAGNVGAIESVDLLVQSAAQHPLSTLILPAQNQPDLDLLPKELRLKVRVVLVQNLHQALFYSLGRWGPQGQTYLYLLEVYRRAAYCLDLGDFAHANYFFRELAARLPEDTSFPLWLGTVEERRAEAQEKGLLAEALTFLSSGDVAAARKKIEAALQARPGSSAAKEALKHLIAVENDPQPPEVSVSVEDGQEFAPQQEVIVRASDNYGVARVAIYIDDEPVASADIVPFRATLDTSGLVAGTHLLKIEVSDISGNVTKRESHFLVGSPVFPEASIPLAP